MGAEEYRSGALRRATAQRALMAMTLLGALLLAGCGSSVAPIEGSAPPPQADQPVPPVMRCAPGTSVEMAQRMPSGCAGGDTERAS